MAAGPVGEGNHILSRFDDDIEELRTLVLDMGISVISQVQRAASALMKCDPGAARRVLDREKKISEYDMEAQERALELLAAHAPVARDLRLVMSLSRSVGDIERSGDAAKLVARMALTYFEHQRAVPNCSVFDDVCKMADYACVQLRRALDAIETGDPDVAVEVLQADKHLDGLFRGAVRRLTTYILEDPRNIGWVVDTLFALKAMERVGDHATNIAENLIFAVKATDVRYMSTENLAGGYLDDKGRLETEAPEE